MSKKGKFSVQNWQSDPMNSPKAFGELKNYFSIPIYSKIMAKFEACSINEPSISEECLGFTYNYYKD